MKVTRCDICGEETECLPKKTGFAPYYSKCDFMSDYDLCLPCKILLFPSNGEESKLSERAKQIVESIKILFENVLKERKNEI